MKKQYVFTLTTTDIYEFIVSCCDTISQMSKETGIPLNQLFHSLYRNQNCCGGRYKVHKVDITEPDDVFNFADYKTWCKYHDLKPSDVRNLVKYKRMLDIYLA